ncbi:hypothetical protein WS89_23165 [Burkholderia sp. MSMB1072]|uniref:autotransporter domain-containing protein n=1 Tax=Burkholderia sp. MSMB1072 TaxID=1637871 RepID=UPI00075A40B7|nr:autotransporter domain-containing protein [Burkholderia sp. MSMB1072]KVH56874.1 hypothetical protein WS89_23165 [Burkholderia sp. MSMB1072]
MPAGRRGAGFTFFRSRCCRPGRHRPLHGRARALRAGGETTHIGFSTLGLRAASPPGSIASGTFTARGTVGMAACVRQRAAVAGVRVRERRTSCQVSGVPIARDSAVLEAGIDANVTKRLTLGLTLQRPV